MPVEELLWAGTMVETISIDKMMVSSFNLIALYILFNLRCATHL